MKDTLLLGTQPRQTNSFHTYFSNSLQLGKGNLHYTSSIGIVVNKPIDSISPSLQLLGLFMLIMAFE